MGLNKAHFNDQIRRYMNLGGGTFKKIIVAAALFCGWPLLGQDNQISLNKFQPGQIKYAGFTLHSDKSVMVEAVGGGGDKVVRRTKNNFVDPQNMFAYGWILNARTRELVWRMTPGNTESDWWGAKYNRKFEGKVPLKKGEYEIYFSANRPLFLEFEGGYFNLKRLWEKVFGDENWWDENADQWHLNLSGADEIFTEEAVDKYQRAQKNSALISLSGVKDYEDQKKGFSLKKKATLRIYAIGEGFDGEMYDFAYIVDANSRERVWTMDEKDTEHAGGALKNRMVRKDISFAPGDYLVYFQSDDSHSHGEWNANPPYDPTYWGVTLSGIGEDFDRSIFYKFEDSEGDLIVKLDHLGDYEEVYEGFALDRPMRLRIYAIGEGRNGEMFDYGWIDNARTGKMVWEMTYDITEPAGGAEKNRRFDGVISLPGGAYMANFITDDSHSYRDWNSPKPLDPSGWGIKIYTIVKGDEKYVKKYDPDMDKHILVQIIRVGDDEHIRKEFQIDHSRDVRIYALGEGRSGEMFDYAWIENYETGKTVWKMEYADTRRAGGASKNRLYDGLIYLEKGRYILHYESDDSHSFAEWNDDPPRDKRNWGVTIFNLNNH